MDVRTILSRLGSVRKNGKQWMAKCPAHPDKSPSLSIREGSDSILMNCFAGCETEQVVAAIGLTMADLFYDSPTERGYRNDQPRMTLHDAVQCLSADFGMIALLTAEWLEGKKPDEETFKRGALAAKRIDAALEFINGQK